MDLDIIYNEDCIAGMASRVPDGSVDAVVTDIPYNEVNREDNGLRSLDKSSADVGEFDLSSLTGTLCDKSRGSVYMFCGINQVSDIRRAMTAKGLSTRVLVWEKTNPSPMNGDTMWLSGIELCVFGKKKGATFNLHCHNCVLRFPSGTHDIHPTQKPVDLMRFLLLASTNPGDVVLDPFMGSGTTAVACIQEGRHYVGFEKDPVYFGRIGPRLDSTRDGHGLFSGLPRVNRKEQAVSAPSIDDEEFD